MPKYRVYLSATVTTPVDVDAPDPNAAIDAAVEKGVPSLLFTDHTVPDVGDWDAFDGDVEERE